MSEGELFASSANVSPAFARSCGINWLFSSANASARSAVDLIAAFRAFLYCRSFFLIKLPAKPFKLPVLSNKLSHFLIFPWCTEGQEKPTTFTSYKEASSKHFSRLSSEVWLLPWIKTSHRFPLEFWTISFNTSALFSRCSSSLIRFWVDPFFTFTILKGSFFFFILFLSSVGFIRSPVLDSDHWFWKYRKSDQIKPESMIGMIQKGWSD